MKSLSLSLLLFDSIVAPVEVDTSGSGSGILLDIFWAKKSLKQHLQHPVNP